MSVTLSPPVRVVVLVGALVATGLAAAVFLLGLGALGGEDFESAAPRTRSVAPGATKPRPAVTQPVVKPKPANIATKTGFPPRIDRALRYRRVVVVSIFMPHAPVDEVVRREAREGAAASRAAYVAMSALDERAMAMLLAKTGLLPDPAVIVLKRPGVVASVFGVSDRDTIAQAVAQARR